MSEDYEVLTVSAINKSTLYSRDRTIGIKSRYASHYRRGIYNDTRVTLIYPKKELKKGITPLNYGPAQPPIILHYDEEYEDSYFYIFDYFTQECYRGIFPSKKTPPFSSLKLLK